MNNDLLCNKDLQRESCTVKSDKHILFSGTIVKDKGENIRQGAICWADESRALTAFYFPSATKYIARQSRSKQVSYTQDNSFFKKSWPLFSAYVSTLPTELLSCQGFATGYFGATYDIARLGVRVCEIVCETIVQLSDAKRTETKGSIPHIWSSPPVAVLTPAMYCLFGQRKTIGWKASFAAYHMQFSLTTPSLIYGLVTNSYVATHHNYGRGYRLYVAN